MNFYDFWFYSLILFLIISIFPIYFFSLFLYFKFKEEQLKREFEKILSEYEVKRK